MRSYAEAVDYLNQPMGTLGRFDAFPQPGMAAGADMDVTGLSLYENWDRDFNGNRREWSIRGAYSGRGSNPGWTPSLSTR
jgi:hypothetical protein